MMRPSRRRRGITLLETLMTAAVLILGIGVVASTVVSIVRLNRRNLAQAQAYTIAEWWLERVTRMGCRAGGTNPCANIEQLDANPPVTLYWNASGIPSETPPLPGANQEAARPYQVTIDVDPPNEGEESGSPPLKRSVAGVILDKTRNVRVTVSWQDELSRDDYHAVALQTRVAP
jgi:type II secretory pathway pseudopilin PulG